MCSAPLLSIRSRLQHGSSRVSSSPLNPPPHVADRIAVLGRDLRRKLLPVACISWSAELFGLAPIVYMFAVYDRVTSTRHIGTLAMLSCALLIAIVAAEVLRYLRTRVQLEASLHLERELAPLVTTAAVDALLRGEERRARGMFADLRNLSQFIASSTAGGMLEAPIAVPFLVALWLMDTSLGAATLAGLALAAGLAWRNEIVLPGRLAQARREADASMRQFVATAHRPAAALAMGMEGRLRDRWQRLQSRFLWSQAGASWDAGVSMAATRFVQLTLGSALLGLAAWLTLQGALPSNGSLIIVASLLGARVLGPIGKVISGWKSLVDARQCKVRLWSALGETSGAQRGMALPAPRGRLSAAALAVAPPGRRAPVLEGLNFNIGPGQALAVVGPSGAGKSCLLKTLVGGWRARAGAARLDGVEIHGWDKRELGHHLGYLGEEVDLFAGSIADNIARFEPASPERDKRLRQAIEASGVQGTLDRIPGGLDAQVGAAGAALSGGQRQSIGLARALYGGPCLLVLDEPNAHLDTAGEAALAIAVLGFKAAGGSVVIATHSSALLHVVDRIVVVAEGRQHMCAGRDEVLAALQRAAQSAVTR